jgi:hypothetical protein
MSSQGSRSRSSSRESRSPSQKREGKINKLYVTNLDANVHFLINFRVTPEKWRNN